MSDLIDRQILKADLLCGDNAEHDYCFPCKEILECIDNQPSAETHDKRTEMHACDCVSRQAAIEVINAVFPVDPMKSEYAQGIACGAALAKTYVEQLPSAQPDACENTCEIARTSNDCISRQAAIDALDGEIEITGRTNAEAVKGYVRLVRDRLERLPSAQPDLSSYSDKLWRNGYERGKAEAEAEIVHCKDCKWKQGAECVKFAEIRVFPDDFCSRAERRTE